MADMKATSGAFLLMVVVLALSCLSLVSSQSWGSFQRKHIDSTVLRGDNNYCNNVITNRRIKDRNGCKPRNTFIHASPDTIKGLCAGPDGSVVSNNPYQLTDCKLDNNNEKPPNCNYQSLVVKRRIKIKCESSAPVHFEGITRN